MTSRGFPQVLKANLKEDGVWYYLIHYTVSYRLRCSYIKEYSNGTKLIAVIAMHM